MKLLTFTSLYPNAQMPSHGVFVENRLRHLVAGGRVEARVVAPVPWFPSGHARFGRFATFARVPARETRHDIAVVHPRYLTMPKIGMNVTPLTMALAARSSIAAIRASGFDFDAIDAHYFYPDGVAAALLAGWFDRPLVITARGSDITQLPDHAGPRRMIRWAATRASAVITVSGSLKHALVALGSDATKIHVLRNGVDLAGFVPTDATRAREHLGLDARGRVIASVGHLIPRKGHELVIEALATIPDLTLLIVGSGPERAALTELAVRLGVDGRVRFLGQRRHDELPMVYNASDALVLASSNEGWANVLLEAMACGTPVVATDVGGSREVVDAPEAGVLVARRDAPSISAALRGLLAALPDRASTRRYAERFSWDDTTHGQERLFGALSCRSMDVLHEGAIVSAAANPVVQPVPEGIKSQVMSALRWAAIAKFGGQLVNWGITLFVMRLLAPGDYGLVAMLTIIFMFLGMLGDMGFGSSIVQSPTLDTREIRQTFGASLLINLGICAMLMIAAPAIAAFYVEPRLVDMTRVAALGFIGAGISPVFSGLLQREMRFRTSARIEIVSGIIGNVATLAFALAGYGAWALILGGLVASPIRVLMFCTSATQFHWPSFRFGNTRRLWSFGGNVLLSRIVWYWSSQADVLIAGKFLGSELLGFYSVAVHLASLPMQRAAGIINGVAFAAFAKIQHDPRAVTQNTKLGVRLMAFVTFPILWGIGAVSPELVRLAIGPAWEQSILPLTLVALTIPFRMIGSIISTTIMSMGRADIAMWTTIIGAFIAPPLFFVGSRYGIVGLSLAWVVVTPILFMLNMFRALPILGLSLRGVVTEMWRPIVISATMFAVVEALRLVLPGLGKLPMFLLLVGAGAIVYVVGTWLINRVAAAEALALLFPGRFAHLRVATAS